MNWVDAFYDLVARICGSLSILILKYYFRWKDLDGP